MTNADGATPAERSQIAGLYALAPTQRGHAAIIDDDTGRVWSYGEVIDDINAVSRGLQTLITGPGSVIVTVLRNRPEVFVIEFAAAQLPIYCTPINWHLTPAEITYIIGDCQPCVVITEASLLDWVKDAATRAGCDSALVFSVDDPGYGGLMGLAPADAVLHRGAGQRLLYTSGTTGHPKGVHRPLSGLEPEQTLGAVATRARLYGVDHDAGVHLVTAPLYHAAPGAYAMQALHLGHTVVMAEKWEPEATLARIAKYQITHTYMVPTMFRRLLALDPAIRAEHDVSRVRSIIHTAAPCPVPVKAAMMEWFGPVLYEIYGGTEGGATVVGPHEWLAHPGTVGRPRAGVDLQILTDDGELAPPGEPGRVFLAIRSQSFSYLNDPAKTAAARVGEFFTLGDIGYVDDEGYLYLCDRAADVIISGGVNVYPAEIEAVLTDHALVSDAAVVGVPDPDWGEHVLAVVVPRDPSVLDGALAVEPAPGADLPVVAVPSLSTALEEWCRSQLAGFKCPRSYVFCAELPRSDVGKLLRRQLREQWWRGSEVRI